jgi:hypothetical protein
MVQALDKLSSWLCVRWLGLRLPVRSALPAIGIPLTKVPEELEKAQIPRQIHFAKTPQYPQIGLEQGKQTFCPLLVHLTARGIVNLTAHHWIS